MAKLAKASVRVQDFLLGSGHELLRVRDEQPDREDDTGMAEGQGTKAATTAGLHGRSGVRSATKENRHRRTCASDYERYQQDRI